MTRADKLETKRERIIHNEKRRQLANGLINLGILVGIGGAFYTVINWKASGSLPSEPSLGGFLLAAMFITGLSVSAAMILLNDLVDPDDLHKPKRTKRRTRSKTK